MAPSQGLLVAFLFVSPVTCTASVSKIQTSTKSFGRVAVGEDRHVATCEEIGDVGCEKNHVRRRWFGGSMLTELRGGSTAPPQEESVERDEVSGPRDIRVLVSTTKISSYVDAGVDFLLTESDAPIVKMRGEVTARSDWTVQELRKELEQKFPGKIPASVQRLFKGTQLLPSDMTLEEAAEGTEGPLSLLLDNAPPIDATRFDPDTAVPSRRDGQVEAFSASLAAQTCLQDTLLAAMRGSTGQDDPELTRSVTMKADYENTKALLTRTLQEVPESADSDSPQSFGVLHEALRPLAHTFDVNWMQSAQHALFAYICAQFGSHGVVRQALTYMLIPLIFLAQTRYARVGLKLVRNLAAEVPVVAQLVLGLLQAPGQVILSLDEAAYISELYGPGGPKIDPAFRDESDEDADQFEMATPSAEEDFDFENDSDVDV